MLRYIGPVAFFGLAWIIWAHNADPTNRYSKIAFPGLDSIPALKGDTTTQGQITWILCVVVGVILLLWAAFTTWRDARARRPLHKDEPPPETY